jgi:hypothetical protein
MFDEFVAGIAGMSILTIVLSCLCVMVPLGIAFLAFFLIRRSSRKKAEVLLETGQQGQATILSLEDTGMLINNNPRVRIGLEVTVPGYPPYQVTKTMTVPMIKLPQVQPGLVVAVLADPADPTNPDKVGLLLK